MSMSSPYGQDNGNRSPLGGPSMFGAAQNNIANSPTFQPINQFWNQNMGGGALTGGGSFSPQPQQPAPQAGQSGSAVQPPQLPPWAGGPPDQSLSGTTNNLQPVVGGATNNLQPVVGAAQAPAAVTGDATTMMVNALAQPAPPPANPASFAPQNAAPVALQAPQAPANPLSFLGTPAPAAAPAAPPQNPYGF